MPSIFDRLTKKLKNSSSEKKRKVQEEAVVSSATTGNAPKPAEGEVHILPVPGNENHPPESGGGLNSNPDHAVLAGAGPVITDQPLEAPKTREELQARQAQLNA